MKKILSIILCLVLIVSTLVISSSNVFAATSGNYTYEVTDGKATITDVDTSISGNIAIPSTLGGYPVTSIGEWAFEDCESLTSVTIGNSVTSIGEYAFYNCESLTSVTIGNGVTSIGRDAFSRCTSLTSVKLSNSVTSIGYAAFYGCNNLESITLPFVGSSRTAKDTYDAVFGYIFGYTSSSSESGTTYQYYSSSYGCYYYIPSSLKTVTITDATQIPYGAFYNCTSLTSVKLGNSVTSIGSSAFRSCSSLTSITIPDSVTSIGSWAFSGCDSLTSVNITDIAAWCNIDFESFGANPLYHVENLYLNGELVTDLVIPNTVTEIKKYAFYNCDSLKTIIIPDSVTSIGSSAFYNCSSLTSVTIGNRVTSIGKYAFNNCSSLQEITLPFVGASSNDVNNTYFGYIFGASKYQENNTYVPSSLKKVTITGGTSIESEAFYQCNNIEEVILPSSIRNIYSYAFEQCKKLNSVTIPKEVTSIASTAFYKCDILTINCVKDSTAETFAKYYNIPYTYFTATGKVNGDVNCDGKVDTTDLAVLKLHLAGIE